MDETYVPGMNNRVTPNPNHEMQAPTYAVPYGMTDNDNASEEGNTPVVGFLYSMSKGSTPEYWPLRIGRNRIGKDADMDICLAEASITGHHANINIKRLRKKGNALVASLVDVGSKNGIVLNDEELDYEPHTLNNEDVVTFGYNYKCVVILIDPTKYGLAEAEDFKPTKVAPRPRVNVDPTVPVALGQGPAIPAVPQIPHNDDDIFAGFTDNNTINVSGEGPDLSGGKTQIMS